MPAQVIGIRPARSRAVAYFGPAHPLAEVAVRHCKSHPDPVKPRLGGIACGACWERAVRDDERVVVEYGLSRELVPDVGFVDQVAVDQAVAGLKPVLTERERAVAVGRLAAGGLATTAISDLLGTSNPVVEAVLSEFSPGVTVSLLPEAA